VLFVYNITILNKTKGYELIYFIYITENMQNSRELNGCLSISYTDNNIKDSKMIFQEKSISENINDYWKWAYSNKGIHISINDIDKPEMNIPTSIINFALNHFKKIFSTELINIQKKIDTPDILYLSTKSITEKLTKQKNGDIPTLSEINICKHIKIVQIYSILEDNPTLIFDFPLYLEYLQENKLSKNDFMVEDFLELISNLISI